MFVRYTFPPYMSQFLLQIPWFEQGKGAWRTTVILLKHYLANLRYNMKNDSINETFGLLEKRNITIIYSGELCVEQHLIAYNKNLKRHNCYKYVNWWNSLDIYLINQLAIHLCTNWYSEYFGKHSHLHHFYADNCNEPWWRQLKRYSNIFTCQL